MKKYLIGLALLLNFILPGYAQINFSVSEAQLKAADALLSNWHMQNKFDGTVIIAQHEQVLYKKAFGLADRTWNVPMIAQAKLDIASLNKSVAGVMALQMQEKNLLDLQKTVADYLPDYSGEYANEMTLHQLLTHTSGLADYDAVPDPLKANNFRAFKRMHMSNEDYIAFISQLPRVGEPGEQLHYSNFAYHLLLMIMEKESGKTFNELLQEYICQPAGMTHTINPPSREFIVGQSAEAYNYKPYLNAPGDTLYRYERNQFIDLSLGRRIFSTVEDMHRFANGIYNGTLLNKKSQEQLTTNHVKFLNEHFTYGYGFAIHDGGDYWMGKIDIPYHYIVHGGSTEGYKAMMTIVEEGELILIHLSNIGDQTNEMQLTTELLQLLTNTKG